MKVTPALSRDDVGVRSLDRLKAADITRRAGWQDGVYDAKHRRFAVYIGWLGERSLWRLE